jgi:thymidylate synthase (FAD)
MITLISDITVTPLQHMGGDSAVISAARVSTLGRDTVEELTKDAEGSYGLLRFLMKHRHGTPFEHGSISFLVHAPIFVWREWHRHRVGFSYNEESARYKPLDPVFWVPRRDRPMIPVEGWKPGRPKFQTLDQWLAAKEPGEDPQVIANVADHHYFHLVAGKKRAYRIAYEQYRQDISVGFAMEVARSVLPVGIYSSCWVTCNPRSLMHFLSLRTHDETASFVSYPQLEIEEAARQTERFFAEHWPLCYRAFVECGRVAP